MLSANQVVAARRAIEKTYDGICTITERQKVQKPNKTTGFIDVVVAQKQPCRVSFSSKSVASQGEEAAALGQTIKVFLSPDITVGPGSKLTVTQNSVTTDYVNSGMAAVYETHQEIVLDLFQGWA